MKGKGFSVHHSALRVQRFPFFPSCYTPQRFSSAIRLEQFAQMMDSDLLDPYERLISIEILGNRVEVPENNRLLRCFQFLSMHTISYGDFCWNGDCTNCQIWYHREGQTEGDDKPALSCRTNVSEGMVITRLSRFVELEGINK
jgi:hypothetical protein